MVSEEDYDLDSVLEELGNFGRFQFINYVLICLPIAFNAIFTLSYVFTASNLEYRCKIPECDSEGSNYLEPWLNYTVPFKDGLPSQCSRYSTINETLYQLFSTSSKYCSKDYFNISSIESCNNDFIYNSEEKTIANEWNITCPDNEWMLTLVGSVNNIGQFVGMPLGGYVSDRYGRRTALVLGAILSALMGVLRSLSFNYSMFIILEFLDSALGSVIYSAAFILGIELVGAKKRVLGSSVLAAFYPVGEVLLGVTAMLTQDWRLLLQILYAPAFLHLFYLWITPESVRWLLTQGKSGDAIKVLRRAAKFNGVTLSESSLVRLHKPDFQEQPSAIEKKKRSHDDYPILLAFKSPMLFWRMVNCSFCWLTNTFVYYGLSLSSVSLAGDKYINFILVCSVEIPAFFIVYFVMEKAGRRLSQSGSLLLSGLACIATIFIDPGQPWIGLALFLIGKLAITVSFTVLYVYTTEMFPTNLRHSLLSVCSMFGRIGSIIAPQTPLMALYFAPLPLILFGACAVLSGILVLWFPETLNTRLPDTILEAETIGNKKK